MKIILVTVSLLFLSCATDIELSDDGRRVKIVRENVPANLCQELGEVTGSGFTVTSYNDYYNQMRNQTARLGGNILRLRSHSYGTAYLCQYARK